MNRYAANPAQTGGVALDFVQRGEASENKPESPMWGMNQEQYIENTSEYNMSHNPKPSPLCKFFLLYADFK